MGNEAVAMGALAAGVQVVSGYPGTPSSEVLETIAKRNPGGVYVEWSVNEKAGAEVAAGAAYAGARSLVTMKQMGLNVASDPVMCVNYIGVKGGMVVYVCDDPGPISSQTEQDTRNFAKYAHIPCFDCDSPEQAFQAVQDAFAFSEAHGTPVILRSTTRVCHACADIDVPEIKSPAAPEGFKKDPRWVIFPKLAYEAKLRVAGREPSLAEEFSEYEGNSIEGNGPVGIACGGISYAYVKEAIRGQEEQFTVLKIATPYPFPADLARQFLLGVDKVICFEELDPYIEDALIYEYGSLSLDIDHFIEGKRTDAVRLGGELSATEVGEVIENLTGVETTIPFREADDAPALPVRPPVLCAGCPHRGSFYAVKKAVGKRPAIYSGDIGCYTLGNAAPLDMVDTCLCMGAGITLAQGLDHAIGDDTVCFAFVGDSTFFASGITGTVNAVYNQSNIILCVLDNSTTAMTGHQPHPGMGVTMMGERVEPVDIGKVLEGIGVKSIRTVDPQNLEESVKAVQDAIEEKGVRAIIFKSPCIALVKPDDPKRVDADTCIGCMQCVNEIGCPALITKDGKALIDKSLCTGCGLCAQICPVEAIG
ncbi:MAG: indolepyruvate ferredoxin oxidoreductase subunit alpha [Clostridiales bacterium]|nr:indolepyruvate ferredoxin oxidoreductase subunit alpha [Clostridiales bacterium]